VIPLALAISLAASPSLACPPGSEHRGAVPFVGFEEWCDAPGPDGKPRRQGPARTYYDDGGVWTESTYRDGLLDGPYLERYRGGAKAREGQYQAGLRAGRWVVYFEDGTTAEDATFSRGVSNGPFHAYWPNGKAKTTGRHCMGAQCGRWVTYDELGRELSTVDFGMQTTEP